MEELLDLINISEEEDYLLSGTTLLKDMQIEKSIEFFDMAIEKNKRNKDSYFCKGIALLMLEEYDKAKDMFKTCILIDKSFGKAYMLLGDIAFFVDKRTELALDNYNKAIINNFDVEQVHLSKAFIYSVMKDYISTIKSYNKALLINPKSKRAILGKLEIYFTQCKFREAEDCVKKLREIDTECEEYYTWASLVNIAQDREQEAINILNEAKQVIGFSEKLAFARIKIYEKLSKIDSAIDYIESIEEDLIENDQAYYKVMNQKISYYLKLNNILEAKKLLEKLSKEYDSLEVDFKLGTLLIDEKEFSDALIYFDKIIDRGIEYNEYFSTSVYMKAICKDDLGEKEEAKELFEEALLFIKASCLSDPTNIELINMKSLCLYQLDKLDEAELSIKKSLKLSSKELNSLIIGAKIAYKMNNKNLGKERVNTILKIKPEYKEFLDDELKTLLMGE